MKFFFLISLSIFPFLLPFLQQIICPYLCVYNNYHHFLVEMFFFSFANIYPSMYLYVYNVVCGERRNRLGKVQWWIRLRPLLRALASPEQLELKDVDVTVHHFVELLDKE